MSSSGLPVVFTGSALLELISTGPVSALEFGTTSLAEEVVLLGSFGFVLAEEVVVLGSFGFVLAEEVVVLGSFGFVLAEEVVVPGSFGFVPAEESCVTSDGTLAEESPILMLFTVFDAESSPQAQIIATADAATIVLKSLYFIIPLSMPPQTRLFLVKIYFVSRFSK